MNFPYELSLALLRRGCSRFKKKKRRKKINNNFFFYGLIFALCVVHTLHGTGDSFRLFLLVRLTLLKPVETYFSEF